VGGVTQHVHEKHFCNVAMPVLVVFVLESRPYGSGFLGNYFTLIGCGFACPHSANKLTKSTSHSQVEEGRKTSNSGVK
jgi:hypothetical protein